ncbi:WXG100 family type VII secretion target [Micromonospora lupini]|uniref:WXG100 family type VII secretion target n=1 Tax=Micromonospora lupini TaxID=285679 RepID=UPI0031E0A262
MPNGQLRIDDASTRSLVSAFQNADQEQQTASSSLASIDSSLRAAWQGRASQTYSQGMQEARNGLQKIQQALSEINQSMNQFHVLTTSTEDDNTSLAGQHLFQGAGSWAR